jgi:hypothetical protein
MLASRQQRHAQAWGSYCARRDSLAAGLQQQAAALAAGLKQWLDGDDAAVEAQMARLGDDVVMELSEGGIHQVCFGGSGRCAGRGRQPQGGSALPACGGPPPRALPAQETAGECSRIKGAAPAAAEPPCACMSPPQLWDEIAAGVPARAARIDQLGALLEAAEVQLAADLKRQLAELLAAACDVAAVSEGEAGRLVEAEALAANQAALARRQQYADLLERLHVREVRPAALQGQLLGPCDLEADQHCPGAPAARRAVLDQHPHLHTHPPG